jgi:hypothetical protein
MKASSAAIGGILAVVTSVATMVLPVGAATVPSLSMTKGPFHNEQLINLSVGPNRFFKPYSRVNVLECADPGGKKSHLPSNVSTCDGNTIQGNTILVNKNGSFSEHGYQLFTLPNIELGESPAGQPVCSHKKSCVLYVGANQENFSAPKLFSPPFTIAPSKKKR